MSEFIEIGNAIIKKEPDLEINDINVEEDQKLEKSLKENSNDLERSSLTKNQKLKCDICMKSLKNSLTLSAHKTFYHTSKQA